MMRSYDRPSEHSPTSSCTLEELDDEADEDLNDSVDALCVPTILAESIPGESATKARKYLRRDMENRLTEGPGVENF
jgi:hypothetical protein